MMDELKKTLAFRLMLNWSLIEKDRVKPISDSKLMPTPRSDMSEDKVVSLAATTEMLEENK